MPPESESSAPPASSPSSRRRRFAIAAVVAVCAYALVGYVVVPRIVASQIVTQLEALTGRVATVDDVAFDPFGFALVVEGFALPDASPDAPPVVTFEALRVDVHVPSLLIGRIALENVGLEGPHVEAVIDPAGTLNLTQILLPQDAEPEAEAPASEDGEALVVDVASISLTEGGVRFVDRSQAPPFEAAIQPLDFELKGFTTRAGGESPYTLSLRLGDRTRLDWSGTFGLDPIRSEGEIQLSDFDLRLPWDFLSDQLRFEVRQGALEVAGRYVVAVEEALRFEVVDARVGVTSLALVDPAAEGEVFLDVSSLAVSGVALTGGEAGLTSVGVGEVALDGAAVDVVRDAEGAIQLVSLFEVESGASEEAAPPSTVGADAANAPDAAAPEIRIDRVAVRDLAVDWRDESTPQPVTLRVDPLGLTVEGFSSQAGSSVDIVFDATVGAGGRLGVRGPLTLEPLETRLEIEVAGLGLGQFQPYLDEVAHLDVPQGELAAKLDVGYAALGASSDGPSLSASGRVQLDDLITIDRLLERRFVEWKSLRIEGIDYQRGPSAAAADRVRIEEIALAGAEAHVVVGNEGRTNVDAIFDSGDAPRAPSPSSDTEPPAPSGPAPEIEIGRIVLEGVGADFDDLTLEPHFAIGLDDLKGEIAGLSSSEGARATVALDGRLDDVAPVRIAGQINPLAGDSYTDLAIDVSGVSLPAFTPYSGRFVGRRINRGKLGLDLDYKVNARHLEASNVIELQQFAFGDRVESAEATRLPIGLALAVLRDRSGDIRIPLPIEGDLDDPSFSVFGLLGQTFVNLITRVATSPFGAIAGMVGGAAADDLARVAFSAGSDRLAENEKGELAQVAAMLSERPALRLEIRGRADPEVDRPGLRRERVLDVVRRAAFQDLSRREREALGNASALVLDDRARFEGIATLYRKRKGERLESLLPEAELPSEPAARDAALAEAGLAALAADVAVEDAAWRTLARSRAAAVQGAVLATGQIPAERVFLVDVEVGPIGADGIVPTELGLSTD